MSYDQQIINVLLEAGMRGISVKSIARHVYNRNCTFFSQPDFREIHVYVQAFLLRNSKSAHSLVEKTGVRGYYRLNTSGSADARHLMLDFQHQRDGTEKTEESTVKEDLSLDLFA